MKHEFDADDVIRMRGLLLSVTHYLRDIMENGIPKPPPRRASVDAKSADMEWHECRWHDIKQAEEFLKETEDAAKKVESITLTPRRKS